MHAIEPYYNWRDLYTAEEDRYSPFYGREYSEFEFTNSIYNYCIHPQWDSFGSPTLYLKILFVDYNHQFAIIELIGEWNDCINNDIMYMKQEVMEHLQLNGINKYILICENVLNFHGSDDCYYQELNEDLSETGGWVSCINVRDHIAEEMRSYGISAYCSFGSDFNNMNWRVYEPVNFFNFLDRKINKEIAELRDVI